MITLSIVIVSFSTKEYLRSCIDSIVKNKGNVELEIIVVDNDSRDGSKEYLKSQSVSRRTNLKTTDQNLKLIFNNGNLGFAKANNQGIKEAKGKYILLLNSDTEIKPGALEEMITFADSHSDAGVVGARLLNPDGSIQPSVYHIPTVWGAVKEYWLGQKGAYGKYYPDDKQLTFVDAVVGAAMLIPRRIIETVGLLDERYFMYFEDLDYCRRVRKAGLQVYYFPDSEVIHYHGASGKGSNLTYRYLVESSKLYNGVVKFSLLALIIWSSQKWQKVFGKR